MRALVRSVSASTSSTAVARRAPGVGAGSLGRGLLFFGANSDIERAEVGPAGLGVVDEVVERAAGRSSEVAANVSADREMLGLGRTDHQAKLLLAELLDLRQ